MKFSSAFPGFCSRASFFCYVRMFFLLAVLHGPVHAQKIPVDTMYSTIKQFNCHARGANWTAIDESFYAGLKQAGSSIDTLQVFVDVFEALDDVHSTIQFNGQTYGYYHEVTQDVSAKIMPTLQRQRSEAGKVFDTLFPENIAYIRIPTILAWGDDVHTIARSIQDSLCMMLDKNTKGCIVDLRLNGGGNMYPMIAGLFPLLGNTDVLHTTYTDSTIQYTWLLKNGDLFAKNTDGSKAAVTHVQDGCEEVYTKMKVMVLLGPATMSSGQATAVAFYKRDNTLFIGESTANGYTTATNYYPFENGVFMNMASGFISDREGKIYPRVVDPQLFVIGGDNFDDLSKDLKVQMARWRIADK